MKTSFLKLAIIALSISPVWAQEFKLPLNIEKLAERAKETVDVTLDADMLRLASGFLSKDDPDEAQVKKLVAKLKGIYVRSFEFEKEGQYSLKEVQELREQLKGPNWSRIVGVKSSKGDNTEVYILKAGDQIGGLVVVDAEPKELTIVHIDGSISPDDLNKLSGHMGIPEFKKEHKHGKDDSGGTNKDEDKEDLSVEKEAN